MKPVLFLCLCVSSAAFAQGRWRTVATLEQARYGHTATLLNDGRVLIAGGIGNQSLKALASVELFNPRTQKFTRVSALSQGRFGHTATLLNDGRVLIAGGAAYSDDEKPRYLTLDSTEIFNPRTLAFEAGPRLLEARHWHTATVLNDGRVLIAAGAREQMTHLASVELWNGTDAVFSPGTPLKIPRCRHQALLLPDGSVLLVGGRSNSGTAGFGRPHASSELWPSPTGELPMMSEARQDHAVWLSPQGHVLAIAGKTESGFTNLIDSFSTKNNRWLPFTPSLPLPLAHHTVTALDAKGFLLVGGETPNAPDRASTELLDFAALRFCRAGELAVPRRAHTATRLLDGQVLVVGGLSAGLPEASAERWQPLSGTCEPPLALEANP